MNMFLCMADWKPTAKISSVRSRELLSAITSITVASADVAEEEQEDEEASTCYDNHDSSNVITLKRINHSVLLTDE